MKPTYLNINRYIFPFLLLLIFFAAYLQYLVSENTVKLKEEEIFKTEEYAKNISQWIIKRTGKEIEPVLASNSSLRTQLNEILETFLIPKYEYIFLLAKDKKGHYRFLLDGSQTEKEEFGTIFFPQSKRFDEVYETKQMQIIRQEDDVKGVWLSLLYPVVESGETKALLVLDLSKWYGEYIENFNSPLSHVIRLMQIFLLVSFLLLLFFTYRYYQFRKKVLFDTLTHAYTKLYMEEFFNRNRVDDYHAILIDIDEFKEINRLYGYESGDIALREFVKTLMSVLPKEASVVRIGGTEFFIFLPKKEPLEAIAGKIFNTIREKRYIIQDEVVKITISMSAMEIPEDTHEIQHVLRVLDEGLLKIKSQGKNSLLVMNVQTSNEIRHRNIDYIKKALDEERLVCLYQPVFDTQTRKIVKYEALARLRDDEDPSVLISPAEFIDPIKGTSQYIKMSKLVLNEVFSMLEKYPQAEFSVNLDLDDLYNYDMMHMIIHHLHTHKEVANRLTFEIVEHNEILDYAKVNFIFDQLREFGSKIAIDDFGSGYSNYSYLIRMNIDILKIDGSLVCELINNNERAKEVLSSIKTLSDRFGYELVAEYVSNQEIFEEIRALDIAYVQGYYLGKPAFIETYID